MCYYGEVVCFSEKCTPLKIGCRRINSEEKCCGKIVCGTSHAHFIPWKQNFYIIYNFTVVTFIIHFSLAVAYIVEAGESPTVVLDRADATAPSQRQPTVSPDPFRDVIKTEPAPDLPSLIEDMIPYLVEHGITTPRPTTSMEASTSKIPGAQGLAGNQPQHPSDFDFVEQMLHIRPPFDYAGETADSSFASKIEYGMNGDALPADTVSLTYDSNHQLPDPGKSESVLEYSSGVVNGTTALTESSHTIDDDSENDFRRSNITEEQFATGNLSKTDDPDRKFASEVNDRITKHGDRTESNNSPNKSGEMVGDAEDDAIFSLDSVFESLFSANSSSDVKPSENATKMPDVVSTISGARENQEILSSTTTERLTEETSSKVLDNEIPMGTLLKLAGCNIYGRMYRVGRIITELSSLCQECRCTEIGVQCKQLEC